MDLKHNLLPYLTGEKFSEGLYVPLAQSQRNIPDRINYIVEYCRGKKIIHVGCIDHEPLILKKIEANTWLHKRIDDVAGKQVGIDINKSGISFVKERTGFSNVYFEDVTSLQPAGEFIRDEYWDAMILGEVLEHVNDPISFLKKMKKKYSPFVKEVLISVPNAFAWENFRLAIRHKECINSDHRAWFSVYTLAKNLAEAGYHNFSYDFVGFEPEDYKSRYLIKLLLKKFPALRSTIMMKAQFEPS
jgi:hypothetical protein